MNKTDFILLKTDLTEIPEIGLEGLDIKSMASYFGGYVSNLSSLLTLKACPSNLIKSDYDIALKHVSNLKRTDAEYITIYTPEYISENYIAYLEQLKTTLHNLRDIDKNLITPLTEWSLKMATVPNYVNEVWMFPTVGNTVEVDTKKIQSFFNGSVGSEIAERRFYTTYKDGNGLKLVQNLINEMVEISSEILTKNLYEKSTKLAANIKRLTDVRNNENLLEALPKEKSLMISRMTYQAAKELELLAMVLHLIKVAAYAHQESLIKLKKNLG